MCDDDYICEAMDLVGAAAAAYCNCTASGNIIEYLENKLIGEGHTHPTDFPTACPDWAEEEAINRAVKMSAATRCPTYVVHLSTQLGLERIKQAQSLGQRVWTETCPQYLLLSDAQDGRVRAAGENRPAAAPEDGPDRDALWQGLRQGNVSIVASDHSPHPASSSSPAGTTSLSMPTARPSPSALPASRPSCR